MPCRGPFWPDAPWSPCPLAWGQSPPGAAGSPQRSIPPGSPQPASLSLQLATQTGLFWSLPSPSATTGRRPRSSEGHFSPQHFHRICSVDELHQQLHAGSGLAGPPAWLSGTFRPKQLFHLLCREVSEHRETPGTLRSGVTGRKAEAAVPGSASSQASGRPAEPPYSWAGSLEDSRVQSCRRSRLPASHGPRPRPPASRLAAAAGHASSHWSEGGVQRGHGGGYIIVGGWAVQRPQRTLHNARVG